MAVTVTTPTTIIVKDSAARGPVGPAPTFAIGNVTTGAENSSASITNVGNSANIVLDISIPRGNTGNAGPTGPANPEAYDQANLAYGRANGAYAHANIVYAQANTARTTANDAYAQANAAYNAANSGGGGGANTGNVTFQDNFVIGTGDAELGMPGLFFASGPTQIANLQYIRLRGGDDPTHIHFDTANAEQYDFYFGDDNKYIKLEHGFSGNVVISPWALNNKIWIFDTNGGLTFPDSTIQTTAYTGGGAGLPLANGTSNVDIALANGYVTVTANAFTWTFNETNGLLELAGNLANFSACSAINFVANSSGDGAGYSTIELRPDSNATNDQYLIIDPTVPNHIHIRAGGTQDNSNGQIFLGGEYSYFSVGSGLNPSVYITANQRSWSFNNDGTITFPDSTTQTTAYTGTDIITTKKVFETINALSSATGVVNHNCNNGHIFVHSSVSANFTANFTNTTIAPNTATSFTLVINQGATPYVANAVQIGGVAQTVNWQGSTSAPGGNANKKDVISFSVVNNNGTWIMLGQLTSFG